MNALLERIERAISPTTRRLILVLSILACAALAVFPRQHLARVKIMPPQSSSAGLGALLNQLGGLASFAPLLNNRQPIEVYLVLARSNDVVQEVIHRANLTARFGVADAAAASKVLGRWVDVHALRGGVIEIEVQGRGPSLPLEIAQAYAEAFQDRLSALAKQEVGRKRELMNDQLMRASTRLAGAEQALTTFRTTNKIASPEAQLGSAVSLLASLQARLMAKEVELATVRQFATDTAYDVQRVQSEITGLKREMQKSERAQEQQDPFGFQGFTSRSAVYLGLYRDLKYAEALYEVYSRYLEAVNLEEVSASINAQIVESPYLDPHVVVNLTALGLGVALLFLAALLESRSRVAAGESRP